MFSTIEHGDVLEPGDKRFQELTVVKRVSDNEGRTNAQLAVNMRVRVYPGTEDESPGVIVEDFGELAGQAVDTGPPVGGGAGHRQPGIRGY